MNDTGLYIHVPFCVKKCPYCDFYSIAANGLQMDAYADAMVQKIMAYGQKMPRSFSSLYFGGGTPSLLGAERLERILKAARPFMLEDAEITLEANPGDDLAPLFQRLYGAGVNRISLGLQSADGAELQTLGRRHTAEQAAQAVEQAQVVGFRNLSLDLMLAIPGQTKESLARSIAFCADLGVEHISAYLLKLEPGTPFGDRPDALSLPDEDASADLYLLAVEELARHGYRQYEISNFAKPGYEGQHNLIYWHCREYLGLGPAAHSFLEGKRFYWPRDLQGFLEGAPPVDDGPGGGFEEYAMLAMRLCEGLRNADCRARFGHGIPTHCLNAARRYEKAGLTDCSGGDIRFTPKGFLVSNALLAEILAE